jgi:flagellar biosynthesis/type III secretory pathway chaperone
MLTSIWSAINCSYKKFKKNGIMKNTRIQKYKAAEYQQLFQHFDKEGIESFYIFEHQQFDSDREKRCEQVQELRSIVMKLKQELNLINTQIEEKNEESSNSFERILCKPPGGSIPRLSSNKW